MKYSTTLLAAANIVALVQAAPASVCSQVVITYTGAPVWVPTPDPAWLGWSTTTKSSAKPTSTDPVWPEWTTTSSKKPAAASADPWDGWSSSSSKKPAPTTKGGDPWNGWTTTTSAKGSSPTYTGPYPPFGNGTYTTTATTTASTTASATTTTAASVATCPADNGATVLGGGDCGCEFQVNCDAHAQYTSDTQFWERSTGEIILSLAECLQICDSNSDCTAAIWVDDSTASAEDYHRCWQTTGLGAVYEAGYGQISYKGDCSNSCSGYNYYQASS